MAIAGGVGRAAAVETERTQDPRPCDRSAHLRREPRQQLPARDRQVAGLSQAASDVVSTQPGAHRRRRARGRRDLAVLRLDDRQAHRAWRRSRRSIGAARRRAGASAHRRRRDQRAVPARRAGDRFVRQRQARHRIDRTRARRAVRPGAARPAAGRCCSHHAHVDRRMAVEDARPVRAPRWLARAGRVHAPFRFRVSRRGQVGLRYLQARRQPLAESRRRRRRAGHRPVSDR